MGAGVLVGAEPRGERDSGRALSRCGIALATPPLWTTWRPRWLPWYLESYINGVHTFTTSAAVAVSDFPVDGVCVRGAGGRISCCSANGRRKIRGATVGACSARRASGYYYLSHVAGRAAGAALRGVRLLAHEPEFFSRARGHPAGDYPWVVYAWCRWGLAQFGFSPLMQMGQTSLLVYWVHIEFVYGRFSILPKRAQIDSDGHAGFVADLLRRWCCCPWRGRDGRGAARKFCAWLRRAPRAGGERLKGSVAELAGCGAGFEASAGLGEVLKIYSPGRARPISSRAIRSMRRDRFSAIFTWSCNLAGFLR